MLVTAEQMRKFAAFGKRGVPGMADEYEAWGESLG